MEPRPGTSDGAVGDPGAPPRQRWRLVLARSADAPRLGGRELSDAWETAIEGTGLPLHRPAGRLRARVAFGAPLPLGMAAEQELADVFLIERVPAWRMREAIDGRLPDGWDLVDCYDVWLGGPPLAGRVVAAGYRIELDELANAAELAVAARALLDATQLVRERRKGETTVPYDLRPLLVDVSVEAAGPQPIVHARTRLHPELGTGRPEEVIAALADRLGRPLVIRTIVRERLILADEPG